MPVFPVMSKMFFDVAVIHLDKGRKKHVKLSFHAANLHSYSHSLHQSILGVPNNQNVMGLFSLLGLVKESEDQKKYN
jgi:hypothetical protein